MILGKDSKRRWSKHDLLIAEAYELYQGLLCSQCGFPKYICHSPSGEIDVELLEDTCSVKYEIERRNAAQKSETYGTVYLPQPKSLTGRSLDSYRAEYYAEERKRWATPESEN